MQMCWRNDWKTWVRCLKRPQVATCETEKKNMRKSGKDCKNARGKVYKESVFVFEYTVGERKVAPFWNQMSVERSFSTDSQRYWHCNLNGNGTMGWKSLRSQMLVFIFFWCQLKRVFLLLIHRDIDIAIWMAAGPWDEKAQGLKCWCYYFSCRCRYYWEVVSTSPLTQDFLQYFSHNIAIVPLFIIWPRAKISQNYLPWNHSLA